MFGSCSCESYALYRIVVRPTSVRRNLLNPWHVDEDYRYVGHHITKPAGQRLIKVFN